MSNKSAAKLVKDARIAKGLTQTELAEKTGVHSNTIAKIEHKALKKAIAYHINKGNLARTPSTVASLLDT